MAALIGLFVGAFVGHMLWRDWGAALGGVAGFFIGAKLFALRKATAAQSGRSTSSARAGRGTVETPAERERALLARINELERRVARLEKAGGTAVIAEEPRVTPQPTEAFVQQPATSTETLAASEAPFAASGTPFAASGTPFAASTEPLTASTLEVP